MKPDDVKQAIGYSKLSNSSKTSFALAYQWFCKTNRLKWEKPKYKWNLKAPIIPTTDQVNKIISATTNRFATIYKLMAEIGIEGEELHQTHRNQYEPTQKIFNVRGLKGHDSANYQLKPHIAEMLTEYLTKNPEDYPFPRPKTMAMMWRRARVKAAKNHNDPTLLAIPMKNLRNYSGAQHYLNMERPDPIDTMRHFRHKRMETTMHYLRNMIIDQDPHYDVGEATTPEQCKELGQKGYTKFDEIDGKHLYRKRQQTE